MRKTPLTKEEKATVEDLLKRLGLIPPVAGQITFNLDSQGKVANAEVGRLLFR